MFAGDKKTHLSHIQNPSAGDSGKRGFIGTDLRAAGNGLSLSHNSMVML
jgi:hypothetical protein